MSIRCWLVSSSNRVFPSTLPSRRDLPALDVALNEQFSFQVALRSDATKPTTVAIEAGGTAGWNIRVRRVGYVPLRHHNTPIMDSPLDCDGLGRIPGFVPDPLFEETTLELPQEETHAFWITVRPGRNVQPGRHSIRMTVIPESGRRQTLTARVNVHDLALAPRRDFPITHWFYADALIDWYKTNLFDRRFWEVLQPYVQNMVTHGQDTLYVPVFTPPLDGVKRPSQLLRVHEPSSGRYRFDWSDVRRYIATARRVGIRHFEWCHPFTQWGVKHALRIYRDQGQDGRLLWKPETGATSPTYRRFLSQFLPELHRFLTRENILNRSFFHVSDEPHGEEHLANYRKARNLLGELAPWMKVMDAISEIQYGRDGLTDMPIPTIRTALDFVRESIPSWCYYCCSPRGPFLNRLMDTPLAKIAMHGFLFYRWPFKGFLHWGHNYWYKRQTLDLIDPFSVQDGCSWPGWAYGDTFVVYPGPNGPIDSIRWEVFGESLQDYRLLQTLDISRGDPMLRPLQSFETFPKREAWRQATRQKLLSCAAARRR